MADKKRKVNPVISGLNKGLVGDVLGTPVDLATLAANGLIAGGGYLGHKVGLLDSPPDLIENPIGGSDWFNGLMAEQGYTNPESDTGLGEDLTRFGSAMIGPAAIMRGAAEAPRMAQGAGRMASKGADLINEGAYRATKNLRPTYTNVESATTPIPYGSADGAGLASRGIQSRGQYPSLPQAHDVAVRGTMADPTRPGVMPSLGAWTEGGVNYVNPASSIDLGRGIRNFDGVPPEVQQLAGDLQQTGAGMSRFTPHLINTPRNASAVEFKASPTPQQMQGLLDTISSDGFVQHVPQQGTVRGHFMGPDDVAAMQSVFGGKPRYGRADAAYSGDYPLAAEHRTMKQGTQIQRDNTFSNAYAGHVNDGSGVQQHSAGGAYPFGSGLREAPGGYEPFVFGPSIPGYEDLGRTFPSAGAAGDYGQDVALQRKAKKKGK